MGSDPFCSLVEFYPVENWWPSRSRFEVIVGAILVQNTRWSNVAAAIRELRRAGCLTPTAMRDCSPARLRRLIHSAGCQSIKARRLKAVATFIDDSGGLNQLAKQPTETLRKALLKVHGIGPETADAMLGFAFKRKVFIADQYARRWLWRMGLAPDEILHDYDGGRRLGEKLLQRSVIDRQDVHAAIVLHGQAVCKRVPDCPRCFIRRQCKEGSKNWGQSKIFRQQGSDV